MKIIAKTLQGLEEVLQRELKGIGVENATILKRAVEYEGNLEVLYKSNLYLRTAMRILVPIADFTANSEDELYKKIYDIEWTDIFSLKDTFSIDINSNSDIFSHSRYALYKFKDAVVDKMRDKWGKRININQYDPTIKLNVRIFKNQVNVSMDSSGDSLHLRGYKIDGLQAPLSEVLASGILLNSNIDKINHLHDPMCGSGTLISEALMIATDTAPNIFREKFGFMNWGDFSTKTWSNVIKEAKDKICSPKFKISGSDISRKAVFATKRNITALAHADTVDLSKQDFFKSEKIKGTDTLIFNPPYDIRLKEDEIITFYKKIGDTLKQKYKDTNAWIFSGNIDALKQIGLKASKKIKLLNGNIDSELRLFEMF